MKKNWLPVLSLLVLSLLLQASPTWAKVGKVIYTIGINNVERPAVEPLKKGSLLNAGDVIVTGPKGYAQLLLDDGSKIAIRPASRFVIESLEMPATDTEPAIGEGKLVRANFTLEKGGFRTITGRVAKRDPSAYQVSTPSAVIGVRGTLYSARMCTADCSSGSADGLYVGVSNGVVTLENAAGTIDLAKNQFAFTADFNSPPEKLLAPPESLNDEGIDLVEEEAEEESSDEEEGAA